MVRRLRERLSKIEATNCLGSAFVYQADEETTDQATARHLAEHPRDRGRFLIVLDAADTAA